MQVNGVTNIFVRLGTVSSQDNVLAVGSDNPFVQLFSTEEGKCLCKLEGHGSRYFHCLACTNL